MSVFKEFEAKAIRLLAREHFSDSYIDDVVASAELVSYEYSGDGYYLTTSHATLPTERVVCDKPLLLGSSAGAKCGFVLIIDGGELIFECHSWGDAPISRDFREGQVQIEVLS